MWGEYKELREKIEDEKNLKKFDVFISRADADKNPYVENLVATIKKLEISVFYDKDELAWRDNWKERILEDTEKSEFAIIVISTSFFDREWTERELYELLKRQNER